MIYSPQDLPLEEFAGPEPKFAVFGHPIAHSLSPQMQNAALKMLAKSRPDLAKSKYYAFDIEPEKLPDALGQFLEKKFLGINLTIPHKEVVLPFLREVDGLAESAKACNTLLASDGGWIGFNTDGYGLEGALNLAFGRRFKGAEVVILGAGGAARGAAFYALKQGCSSLAIANRSKDRLERLVGDIVAAGFKCAGLALTPDIKIPDSAIVVNATSVGLGSSDAPVLDFSKFPKSAVFFDMPYAKGRQTASVRAARAEGIRAESGLAMLAYQGAKSMNIWTGAEIGELEKVMLEAIL